MNDDDDDLTWRRLRAIGTIHPDAANSERVRARCHAALTRRTPASRDSRRRTQLLLRLESGVASGFVITYVMALLGELLRLYAQR